MIPVDAFDLKILGALQDDGRLTNQELADLAGLSASQCSRRRMRLEEEKVISGYHADLSSEALGFGVIAFIQVGLATHSPDNSKRFRALVNRIDEIVVHLRQQRPVTFGDEPQPVRKYAVREQSRLEAERRVNVFLALAGSPRAEAERALAELAV